MKQKTKKRDFKYFCFYVIQSMRTKTLYRNDFLGYKSVPEVIDDMYLCTQKGIYSVQLLMIKRENHSGHKSQRICPSIL